MSTVSVSLEDIEAVSKTALCHHGAADWVASEVAGAIRVAEANKNLICGLYYLESYCIQLKSGRVDGSVEPLVLQPKTSVVQVDARQGFAQPAFSRGLPVATEVVRNSGTATLAVSHSHTCTSLGFFTEQIAQHGFIGIGFTNASAVVSPPNGNKAVLGTNPIAMSIPAAEGGVAFQFDFSTSAVALGKITMAKAAGEKIPLGWAVDSAGNPTDDPAAALDGTLVSAGGYKGFGFGLMSEVLAAAVTGSVSSMNVKGLKLADGPPHDLGQYYLLIDPTAMAGDLFHERIKALAEAVESQQGARLPGSQRSVEDPVTIDSKVWNLAQSLQTS
ncbi:MAG: Ldh family oxidoreductase [Gammaproteobacteria bacterium]|nr:Ldh family oxidoreductase [Gammaproteobacteria bacterium]